jgi:hypothetical protein
MARGPIALARWTYSRQLQLLLSGSLSCLANALSDALLWLLNGLEESCLRPDRAT